MAIANTTIRIKKSLISGNAPSTLANGEIAINSVDGKLYYSTPSGSIQYINNQQTFATINANSSLILASSTTDTLTINPSNNIVVTANTVAKSITLSLANNISVSGNITTGSGTGGNITGANNIYANTVNVSTSLVFPDGTTQTTAGLANTGTIITINGASQLYISNTGYSAGIGSFPALNVAGGILTNYITSPVFYSSDKNGLPAFVINSPQNEYGVIGNFNAGAPSAQTFALGTSTSTTSFAGANSFISLTWSNTGLVQIANTLTVGNTSVTVPSTSTGTGALQVTGGVGVTGNVYANGVYTNGLYYAANGNPIPSGSTVTLSDAINSNSSANAATSNAVYIAVSTALAFSIALG